MKEQLRELRNKVLRQRLKNKNFTIIANNCLAGCIYHDFNLRFDTPTINLYIPFPDYILFLKDLKHFVYADFIELPSENGCPIGLLGGAIKVYFLHYENFNEGVDAWKRRAARIHWDNLFVILSERDGCKALDLRNFDSLPFENKVAFTHVSYSFIYSSFHIKGFEKTKELGNIMNFKGMFGAKIYDQFNWVKFMNKDKKK